MSAAAVSPAADPPSEPEKAAAVRAYCELSARERATTVRKAKWMIALERLRMFRDDVHSGPGHFAERHGATTEIGRMELDLGRALEHWEGLEQEVLDGVVSPAAAAVLGRVFKEGLTESGDDWRALARSVRPRQLLRHFLKRRDEKLAGEVVYTVVANLTFTALEDLARCRELASRAAKRPLSTGATIGVLANEYRRHHDPLCVKPGTRRRPDTTGTADRHVPAEADRAVRARSDDKCRFPRCDHAIWVERAHDTPHRDLGSREADNLHLLCRRHHLQFDAGRFRIEGTPENPRFVLPDGTPIEGRAAYRPGEDPATAAAEERAVEALLAKKEPRTGRPGPVELERPARKREPPRNRAVPRRGSGRHRKR